MNISVVIPHYKTGELTAAVCCKFLENSIGHNLDLIVVDNSPGDRSIEFLTHTSLKDKVRVVPYVTNYVQTHGVALSHGLKFVNTEYVITAETDSYPEHKDWLDYYENAIADGYESAGPLLSLSGGTFMHPAGSLYNMETLAKAQSFCDSNPYFYVSGSAIVNGKIFHLMVRKELFAEFKNNSSRFGIQLSGKPEDLDYNELFFRPMCCTFHDGRSFKNDVDYNTAERNIRTEPPYLLSGSEAVYTRCSYEPGQWMSYYMEATKCKIKYIPTKWVWMPGRENQQAEYSIMENGFKHIWGLTAWKFDASPANAEVRNRKKDVEMQLVSQIPFEDVKNYGKK